MLSAIVVNLNNEQARPLLNRGLEDGNYGDLVDAFLEGNYNNQEVARMAACAAASIRHSPKKRPQMRQVRRTHIDRYKDFAPKSFLLLYHLSK